jgi:hypothetical protein
VVIPATVMVVSVADDRASACCLFGAMVPAVAFMGRR